MAEPYNPHTTKILNLWLQRLSQRPEVDPLLLEQIRNLIHTGQAGAERKIQELIATYKEKAHESH